MGQNETKRAKKENSIEVKKKRFNEAYLKIYVTGKYNKLLEILIGERKQNIDYYDDKNDSAQVSKVDKNNLMKIIKQETVQISLIISIISLSIKMI